MVACVEKHAAVVAHSEAHQMGEALRTTLAVLDMMTDTIMKAVLTQSDAMTAEKVLLDQTYTSTVNLYVNGAS